MSAMKALHTRLLGAALLAVALPATADIQVTPDATGRYVYVQDFNTLGATSRAFEWRDNDTLPGWRLLNFVEQPLVTPTYRGDTGDDTGGSFYSYGLEGDSDRALGGLGSGGGYFGTPAAGQLAGYITVSFRNAGDRDIGSVKLAFEGQQWRQGASDDLNRLVFEYGVGDEFGHVEWVRPGAGFDFESPSPLIVTPAGSPVYGRDALAKQALGGVIRPAWTAGSRLWLRWVVRNHQGFDHGLAIDNLKLTVERP
jgi:hypothetical protein